MQKRNQLLDVAKGVAIILVVWGHALQHSGFDGRIENTLMERFLLSFHMPLFMLISGYLFFFSLQRHSEHDLVRGKAKTFLFPLLTLSVLHFFRAHYKDFDLSKLCDYPLMLVNSLWFFWAMLVITLLMCLVHKWLKDSLLGYLAVLGATLLLPDVYQLRMFVHLYPVFLVGYFYGKYFRGKSIIEGGGSLRLCSSFSH